MHIPPTDLNDLARSYVDAVAILYIFLIFLPFHNTSLRTKDICILTVNKQHHITPHILDTKVGKRMKAILLFAITGFNFLFFNSIQFISKKTRQCLLAICLYTGAFRELSLFYPNSIPSPSHSWVGGVEVAVRIEQTKLPKRPKIKIKIIFLSI